MLYDHLDPVERANLYHLEFDILDEKARFALHGPTIHKEFFCHNWNLFPTDTESILMNLEVTAKTIAFNSMDVSDTENRKVSQLYNCLESVLNMRKEPLKVERICLHKIDIDQAMRIIQKLDKTELRVISLSFGTHPTDLSALRVLALRNERYRLKVHICLDVISYNHLVSIKTLTSHSSTFWHLIVYYNEAVDQDLGSFFDVPLHWCDCRERNRECGDKLNHGNGFSRALHFDLRETEITERIGKTVTEGTAEASTQGDAAVHVLGNRLTMETILKYLDFFDIQILRKVSRNIRDCIDLIRPDPRIQRYTIRIPCKVTTQKTRAVVGIRSDVSVGLSYDRVREKFYRDADNNPQARHYFLQRIASDFEINLRHQKTCLEEFKLVVFHLNGKRLTSQEEEDAIFHENRGDAPGIRFLGMLVDTLKRRAAALKVRKFCPMSMSETEMVEMLSLLDAGALETIEIVSPVRELSMNDAKSGVTINNLAQLNQWRNAKHLICLSTLIVTPIREMRIAHFVNVECLVSAISSEDVSFLKNELLRSGTFHKFKISFLHSTIDDTLHTMIGEPYRTNPDGKKIWYFRVPNTEYYMHIVLDTHNRQEVNGAAKPKVLLLAKVEQEDTPFF